jgi:hypothetical protein
MKIKSLSLISSIALAIAIKVINMRTAEDKMEKICMKISVQDYRQEINKLGKIQVVIIFSIKLHRLIQN